MKRFFVEQQKITDTTVEITGKEFLHLKQVLRQKEGDQIVCFCGNGTDYFCTISKILPTKAICHIDRVEQNNATALNITLFQGTLKLDKFEFVIQKMTELGISAIVPFESAFSVAKIKSEKIERYQKIAIAASKQCGRADVLKVENVLPFEKMTQRLKEFDYIIFANEREQKNSLNNINFGTAKNIALVVGSEGGFSLEEANKLASIATSVSLGKRILRAETAPITLASIVMFLLGQMQI
jgi:16S rRNA (uracil1498-N3)-methyltransferase